MSEVLLFLDALVGALPDGAEQASLVAAALAGLARSRGRAPLLADLLRASLPQARLSL